MNQPNLTRALFLGLSTLALAAMGVAPAAADDAPACTPASTATAVSADGSPEQAVETSDGIGAAGTCTATADCWDGSSVTCTGNQGSCSFVDSDCDPNMVRGYCEADGTKKYCPPCEECRATASCLNGSSVSCTGQSHCAEVNSCYAFCDGVEYWCFDADPNTCPVFN